MMSNGAPTVNLLTSSPRVQVPVPATTSSATRQHTSPPPLQLPRSNATSLPPKAKKKRSHTTPTRDRERRELLALRVEAVELQQQLQQARERLATARTQNREKIASSGSRIVSVAPAWRHIARRALTARQSAEKQNRRLREELTNQLNWSNALQAKMNQRTAAKERNSTDQAAANALGTVAHPLLLAQDEAGITDLELELDDADRAELEMLASELDAAYARTESVFKNHRVGDAPLGVTSTSRKTLASQQDELPVIELRDARVIPFDFRLTIDAVWNAWVLWHLGEAPGRACLLNGVARTQTWRDRSIRLR